MASLAQRLLEDPFSLVGHTLADTYRIERVIGRGGMGMVLAAWQLDMQRRVAIKVPSVDGRPAGPELLARFAREARCAAAIDSEHVCRALDTGTLDDGTPFLVLEYLEGHDLGKELGARERLPAAEAVELVRQACAAVRAAHAIGIVHRDIKPENLFLTERADGTRVLKLLDFGVAKALDGYPFAHHGGSLTATSGVVGSPLYMAPEQLRSSKHVDARCDIWSLGCILYELLTGRRPFGGASLAQLVEAVLLTEPLPFAATRVQAPPGLEAVVRRALQKSPEQRYASATDFDHALAPFAPKYSLGSQASQLGTRAVAPNAHDAPTMVAISGAVPSRAPNARSARRARGPNRLLVLGMLALSCALAAGATLDLWPSDISRTSLSQQASVSGAPNASAQPDRARPSQPTPSTQAAQRAEDTLPHRGGGDARPTRADAALAASDEPPPPWAASVDAGAAVPFAAALRTARAASHRARRTPWVAAFERRPAQPAPAMSVEPAPADAGLGPCDSASELEVLPVSRFGGRR